MTKENDSSSKPLNIKEGYQPGERVERGFQPVDLEGTPPADVKIPVFETGIQRPSTTPEQSTPPTQSQDHE